MNPLTLVKRIQSINAKEADLGISEQASWHAKYKESAYVFVGGIPFDLTEGDLLAVFAQYGEIVDVNLVRDKSTGKSKGFAFVAYEDQRSTNLAVDNLNGAQILGRIVRVDHVSNYKKKQEEDEEEEQKKREARGVCRAFQRGDCTRGDSCRFSHNEQRAANTGWGAEDQRGSNHSYGNNDGPTARTVQSNRVQESGSDGRPRSTDRDALRGSRTVNRDEERGNKRNEPTSRDHNGKNKNRSRRNDDELKDKDEFEERKTRKYESESYRREERGREKDAESYRKEERGREKDSDSYRREGRERESSSYRRRGTDEENRHSSRR